MRRLGAACVILATISCTGGDDPLVEPHDGGSLDGGSLDASIVDGASEGDAGERDASIVDAVIASDARAADAMLVDAETIDASSAGDAGATTELPDPAIDAHRDRLIASLFPAPCDGWASLDPSARAVFLTITHRLAISYLADDSSMLSHVTRLYAALGGGASGSTCGGSENNRLFLAIDDELWGRLVATWDGTSSISDGANAQWIHTRDAAGPHAPFDASDETDVGLLCSLIFEQPGSRPPTAQLHFFQSGSAAPVNRGAIHLPSDPRMLEIDQDYNCIHDSNPTCRDFDEKYAANYGDYECDWVPSDCAPVGTGCYRSVLIR